MSKEAEEFFRQKTIENAKRPRMKKFLALVSREAEGKILQEYADQQLRLYGVVKSLKDKETMTFERFKNKYFIDKSLKTDPFGFTKDLTEEQLIDKYALYLKQNL